MRVSENFTEHEWSCRCGCGQMIIEKELVDVMQIIRDLIGLPVIVHCVNRCPEHNKAVGGVSNSTHLTGQAIDFHIKGIGTNKLHEHIMRFKEENIIRNVGLYDWGCHIDVREDYHFWDRRTT